MSMEFVWHWPQITILILWALALVLHAASDGEPIEGAKYRFGLRMTQVMIYGTILFFGGFWTTVRP